MIMMDFHPLQLFHWSPSLPVYGAHIKPNKIIMMHSISQTEPVAKSSTCPGFRICWVEAMGLSHGWDNLWNAQYYRHLQIRFEQSRNCLFLAAFHVYDPVLWLWQISQAKLSMMLSNWKRNIKRETNWWRLQGCREWQMFFSLRHNRENDMILLLENWHYKWCALGILFISGH